MQIIRYKIYLSLLISFYILVIIYGLVQSPNKYYGKPVGGDFATFWAASKMILAGQSSNIYDEKKLYDVQKKVTGLDQFLPIISYPPVGVLFIAPLSLFPYLVSLILWLGSTLLVFLFVLKRIAPHPLTLWVGITFPGTFGNFVNGNNGFLSAIFIGGGLLFMESFPFIGGLFFGLLTYKPHLAILIPLVLIAGRHWRVLLGMIVSVICLNLVAVSIFGYEIYLVFLKRVPVPFEYLEKGLFPLYQIQSFFGASLLMGIDPLFSRIFYGTIAMFVAVVVLWIWTRKNAPFYFRASALVLGILLVTPHLCSHDLAILALPLAWVGFRIYKEKGRWWNQAFLGLCWFIPLFSHHIASVTKIQIMPFFLLGLLIFILRVNSGLEFREIAVVSHKV